MIVNKNSCMAIACFMFMCILFVDLSQGNTEAPDESVMEELLVMSLEDLLDIEIFTASKKFETIKDSPASVIVVTRQEIRERGYVNLKDVLRDMPGMETVEHYFSEVGTLVPIRGVVGNNKIAFLVNGMRVNPAGGEEFPLRSDFSVRYAERIEIVYGPGSTLYGQDAISAVINVITQTPSEEFSGEALAAVGERNYRDGFLALSDTVPTKAGALELSGFLQYQNMDLQNLSQTYPEWWSGYTSRVETVGEGSPPSRWDKGVNGFFRAQTKNASLQLWHRESSRSSSEGGYLPALLYVDRAVWEDRSTVMEGRYNLEISDRCETETQLTFNRFEVDPKSNYAVYMTATDTLFDDYKYAIGTSFGFEQKLSYQFSDAVSGIMGVAASNHDIIPKASVSGGANRDGDIVSQAGNISYYTVQGDANSSVTIPQAYNMIYQIYGLYGQGHWDITEQVSLVGGVRFDADTRYDKNPVSPRVALNYQPTDNATVKYIYAEAYVAPSPYSAYGICDNGTNLVIPNANLQAEEAKTHEINLTYTKRNISAGLSLYYSKHNNIIILGDAAPATSTIWLDAAGTNSRGLAQSTNTGNSESKGADLMLKYMRESLTLWSSYSYLDYHSTLFGTTNGLPGISRHNVRLGATYRWAMGLTATASLAYRSTPENIGDTSGLYKETRDPYDINLFMNYDLNSYVRFFLGVQNLTDYRYALKGVLTPTPQEGRRIIAGAAAQF
ncbi:TonB-dependent receptor plug domain-containing protein [Planctomycetota bacterium]